MSNKDKMDYLDAGGWTMARALVYMAKKGNKIKRESERKPSTTKQYHKIPVTDGHKGHGIKIGMVSDSLGIKASVCADCRKMVDFLFIREYVHPTGHLKKMLAFKEAKLAGATNLKHIENYKNTISNLKRVIKSRKGTNKGVSNG